MKGLRPGNKAKARALIERLKDEIQRHNDQIEYLSTVFRTEEPEFTEYGTVRPSDYYAVSLNRQEKYWRTKDGRWVSLAKMDAKHRENLLAHLERNAASWQKQWLDISIDWLMAEQFVVLGDGVWHGIQNEIEQLREEYKVDPHVFLHRQPLWRRLAYDYLMSLDSWNSGRKKNA